MSCLALWILCAAADPVVLGRPVVQWVQDLEHASPKVRRGGAFALGEAGPAAAFAVPQLVRALTDADASVREAAAEAIANIAAGHPLLPDDVAEAVPALSGLLKDTEPRVRRSASLALGSLGANADGLRERLSQDGVAAVRQAAARALGHMPSVSAAAVTDLTHALKDPDRVVRRDAAAALGELGPTARSSAPALLALERIESEPTVRRVALAALYKTVGPEHASLARELAELTKATDAETARAAALALAQIGGPAAEAAISPLRPALAAPEVITRRLVVSALASLGPIAAPAVADILRAVHDNDGEVRLLATTALGRLGLATPAVLDALVARLDPGETPTVRRAAEAALAELGPATESAAPRLLQVLKEDKDPQMRRGAIWALARMPERTRAIVLPALEAVLSEAAIDQQPVRHEAAVQLARLLGRETPEAALAVLLEMVRDRQLAAVEALAKVGPRLKRKPEYVRELRAAAEAQDPRLRAAALLALQRIGD